MYNNIDIREKKSGSKFHSSIRNKGKGVYMANIEEKVESLVNKKIEELGYKLYDVQYVKEGQNYFLRIYIEKENGSIDLNDCEKVNNGINDLLDTADYIKEQYFLEVSSTGIEKILRRDKHLESNIGSKVQVNLFRPIEISNNKQKEIIGILKDFSESNIVLQLEDNVSKEIKEILIERKDISQIKTIFDWENF